MQAVFRRFRVVTVASWYVHPHLAATVSGGRLRRPVRRIAGVCHVLQLPGCGPWQHLQLLRFECPVREKLPVPRNTGVNMQVAVPLAIPTFNGSPLAAGDEIGVFTSGGLCVGTSVWDGVNNIGLTVWGFDSVDASHVYKGIKKGDTLCYRVWKASLSKEANANVTYQSGGPTYTTDATAALSSLVAVTTPNVPILVSPANDSAGLLNPTLIWNTAAEGCVI